MYAESIFGFLSLYVFDLRADHLVLDNRSRNSCLGKANFPLLEVTSV